MPIPATAGFGGRPCTVWIDEFALCHQPMEGSWLRSEWPDGGPLWSQSWPRTAAFRIVSDELARIRTERMRSRT